MLIKSVILFLLAMVLIGMVGNLLFPGAIGRGIRGRVVTRALFCKFCGRKLLPSGRCSCGRA